jgi:demethylspheroidene O-methyltransferase
MDVAAPMVPPADHRAASLSLKERWIGWRNRLLASPAFQEWATRFPLTRPIAQARAGQLFGMATGFVYTQVLLAGVRLGLFTRLAEGPASYDQLGLHMGLNAEATRRLVKAAIALELVEPCGPDRVALAALGASLVGTGGVIEMIEHHALLYADLADPVALLRGEPGPRALSHYWAYATDDDPAAVPPKSVTAYSALMAKSQAMIASHVLAAYDIRRHRQLMDVGGGEGVFLIEAARAAPDLRVTLFDLPAVAARAGQRFATAGLSARAQAIGGSFRDGPLPTGADILSLVRVVHDHDDDVVCDLLAKAHAALPPGGTLLLAEPMAETPGAAAMGDAYFGFYLMAMGSGRPRPPAELEAMLRQAGFQSVRRHKSRQPLLVQVMSATA